MSNDTYPTFAERLQLLKSQVETHGAITVIALTDVQLKQCAQAALEALEERDAPARTHGHAKQLLGALRHMAEDTTRLEVELGTCDLGTVANTLQHYYHSLWCVCEEYTALTKLVIY